MILTIPYLKQPVSSNYHIDILHSPALSKIRFSGIFHSHFFNLHLQEQEDEEQQTNHHHYSQEPKTNPTSDADSLISLPKDILTLILSSIPVKDFVKTTALSSHWHHNITSLLPRIDSLQFNTNITTTTLSLPNSLLRRLVITTGPTPISSLKARSLILQSPSLGLQQLEVCNHDLNSYFNFPVYSSKSLTILSLKNCKLHNTHLITCANLKNLKLEQVHMPGSLITCVSASCVSLETLHLVFCKMGKFCRVLNETGSLKNLVIKATMGLVKIDVEAGALQKITLYTRPSMNFLRIRAPGIKKAYLNLAKPLIDVGMIDVEGFIDAAVGIRCLKLRGACFKLLWDQGRLTESFPIQFQMLDVLSLNLDIQLKLHMLFLLKLLESCPNLRVLNLTVISAHGPAYVTIAKYADRLKQLPCLSNRLEEVKLKGFRMRKIEKGVVKILLREGKAMKKMVLKMPEDCPQKKVEAAKELLALREGFIREMQPFRNFYRIDLKLA